MGWVWLLVTFLLLLCLCCGTVGCLACLRFRKDNATEDGGTNEMNVLVAERNQNQSRQAPQPQHRARRIDRARQSFHQSVTKVVPRSRPKQGVSDSTKIRRAKSKRNDELVDQPKSKPQSTLAMITKSIVRKAPSQYQRDAERGTGKPSNPTVTCNSLVLYDPSSAKRKKKKKKKKKKKRMDYS